MTTVTYHDILHSARQLGIEPKDTLLIHSSMKSLGYVEGGPDAVIDAFLEAVSEGTLLFPTLCQDDWAHVYENWHMDAPSSVGLLSNVFRKRPQAIRSDQATHSVAAIGKDAAWFAATHGVTGKRIGIYGDTPFAADSPWEKMYEKNTKMLFLGVSPLYCTMRHYAEYRFVDEAMKEIFQLPQSAERDVGVWTYERRPVVWPHIRNEALCADMQAEGLVRQTRCGDATLTCFESRPFVEHCWAAMREVDERYLWDITSTYRETVEWLQKLKALRAKV